MRRCRMWSILAITSYVITIVFSSKYREEDVGAYLSALSHPTVHASHNHNHNHNSNNNNMHINVHTQMNMDMDMDMNNTSTTSTITAFHDNGNNHIHVLPVKNQIPKPKVQVKVGTDVHDSHVQLHHSLIVEPHNFTTDFDNTNPNNDSINATQVQHAQHPLSLTTATAGWEAAEVDQLIIALLALLSLYGFIAIRRVSRNHHIGNTYTNSTGTGKAKGATRAQIETHLAHTTVTLYDGAPNGKGGSISVEFEQHQCAICLELLTTRLPYGALTGSDQAAIRGDDIDIEFVGDKRDEYEWRNAVRILGCAHAFHAACIDAWLVRSNQCPCCLKQPW